MVVVLAIFALLGLLVWAAYARWGSLWVGCAAFIALGYVLAPQLWTAHIGPIPLTVDRVLLIGFGAAFVWKWRQGEQSNPRGSRHFVLFTIPCACQDPFGRPLRGAV